MEKTATGGKAQVLQDYAAMLRALVPQARGFHCYEQDGSCIWSDEPGAPGRHVSDFQSALAGLRAGNGPGAVRVELQDGVAYLIALCNEKLQQLGILSIVMDADHGVLTAEACANLASPATRTLGRELGLRFRLVEGYRKLGIQAAEERLLHEVDRAVQGPPDTDAMLGQILALVRQYLQLQFAAVLIPDKDISLAQGEGFSPVELELLLENADPATGQQNGDVYKEQIRGPDRAPIGVLVMSGWSGSGFSVRRRRRVGRYLVSQIEAVLARAYDSLTGLMAWPAFEKLLAATVATTTGEPPALMYLDIDRLHVANETLGRDVGDKVLAAFAAILREELAGHATTRIASDSFAALLMETTLGNAREIAIRIAARVAGLEFGQGDRCYRASVSIGISVVEADRRDDPDSAAHADGGALATAQVACGAAKDRGRGRVEVYEPADVSIIRRFDDIQLVGYIRNAIDRGRLALMGQPIVPVKSSGPAQHGYYEVLVRMLDDDDSHVSPADFLSAAERYQLMEDLDRWVVANTLSLLGTHTTNVAASGTRFAINLSGQSLGSEAFLGFVQEQLELSRVPPELLCFEITETVAVANLQRAQNFMQTLRRTGCRFSLDDFGTGLSSFAYLKLFPVDTLKIDGSFIRDLPTNVVSQSVVAAIAEVARVMQLETVAEFVQDDATLDLLGKLGITWAQGYLLGEPGPLAGHVEKLQPLPAGAGLQRSTEHRRG